MFSMYPVCIKIRRRLQRGISLLIALIMIGLVALDIFYIPLWRMGNKQTNSGKKLEFIDWSERRDEKNQLLQKPKQPIFPSLKGTAQVKLVIMTYPGGGGRFVNQLFNYNPDVCLWMEPLEGVYQSMMGSFQSWHPIDLYFLPNGTRRKLLDQEHGNILRNINWIFGHEFEKLPVEVTRSRHFVENDVIHARRYQECLRQTRQSSLAVKCLSFIENVCKGHMWETTKSEKCMENIAVVKHTYTSVKGNDIASKSAVMQSMHKHRKCLHDLQAGTQQCLENLVHGCKEKPIFAISTDKLRWETIEELLKNDPSVRVIYLIRDPRAILESNKESQRYFSDISGKKEAKEAFFLCEKMVSDFKYSNKLIKKYPERVFRFLYEDLYINPIKYIEKIYNFLQIPIPDSVLLYIKMYKIRKERIKLRNFKSKLKTRDKGQYQVTDDIYFWKPLIGFNDMKRSTNYCQMFLDITGYQELLWLNRTEPVTKPVPSKSSKKVIAGRK